MFPAFLGSKHTRHGWSMCRNCALRLSRPPSRTITEKYLQKTIKKEMEWKEQAMQIRKGEKQSMLSFLEERGLVKQVTGQQKDLDDLMTSKRIGVYCGIDPTAPSLHIGHMLPIMVCFWMFVHGYPSFTLLGGATAKIGDPIGREKAREPMKRTVRMDNLMHMHDGLKRLWPRLEAYARRYGFENKAEDGNKRWRRGIVQNSAWWGKKPFTEVLKELGSGVRLATMLGRDTVKKRIASGEGMSFAEFSYPIMQSWDFWELYNQLGVQLQVGGSDQYGNLVAGVEAITWLKENVAHQDDKVPDKPEFAPFGLTTPLLTSPAGEKLGKSVGNAVWLDESMTSPLDLYQHFVRLPDSQIEQYLKWFTFVPTAEISKVMEIHSSEPSKRTAQHLLATEFVELVHGYVIAQGAKAKTKELYPSANEPADLSEVLTKLPPLGVPMPPKSEPPEEWARKMASQFTIQQLNKYAPQSNAFTSNDKKIKLPRSLVLYRSFPAVLYACGLVASKQEGTKLMQNGGAYVAGGHGGNKDMGDEIKWSPIKSFFAGEVAPYILDDSLLMIRTGKWNVKIIEVVDDETFQKEGLTCPGYFGEPFQPSEVDPRPAKKEREPKLKKPRLHKHSSYDPEVNSKSVRSRGSGEAASQRPHRNVSFASGSEKDKTDFRDEPRLRDFPSTNLDSK